MNIAVLGADAESVHAIEQAGKLGFRVIAVDKNPDAPGLKAADVRINIDLSDEESVIEALRPENIDLVLTAPIGRNLVTVGAVNDALGLPGISRQTAVWCSDKYAFHNRLRNKRLREGHCYLANAKEPLNPAGISYPVIFKPRFGSHGRSVYLFNNKKELYELENFLWGDASEETAKETSAEKKEDAAAFARRIKKAMEAHTKLEESKDDPNAEYILEDAFMGSEYALDAVVEGCNVEVVMLRRKLITPPPARQAVGYINVILDEEPRLVSQIKEYMTAVCEALDLKDCMIHSDVIVFGRRTMAIEISASPAGHHVYDEFIPMSTGVDMCYQYLTYMAGEIHNFEPLNNRRTMLHYFDMENCFVHSIPSEDEIKAALPDRVKLRKWICNIKMLDYLGKITDEMSLLGRGYYILEGPSDKALTEAADIIRNEFEVK